MCGKCFLCVFLGHSQPLPGGGGGGRGGGSPLVSGTETILSHFPGGRGVRMLISIDHIIFDFPGGAGPPIPPLDLHMPLVSG